MRRRRATFEPTLAEQIRIILAMSIPGIALGFAFVAAIIYGGSQ